MTREEIAARWPEAVQFAQAMREVFGEGVRLTYARNSEGDELGKPSGSPANRAPDPLGNIPVA